MGERGNHPPGTFSWVDLGTTDADAATAFYAGLLGWEAQEVQAAGGSTYTMLRRDGLEVAGLYAQSAPAPPSWLSYVTVISADGAAERAAELGATVVSEPFDVTEAGRMAVLQDPQGAVFAVWEPRESIGARLVNAPGALAMNQLNASDREAAVAFYSTLFGWRFDQVSSTPAYWSLFNGDRLNGGMMDLPPGVELPSHWLVYFATEDLDAARGRIGELGGTVTIEPTEVPAGRFLVARDPQGAVFALFAGQLDE